MASEFKEGDVIQFAMRGSEGKPPFGVGIVRAQGDGRLHLTGYKRPGEKGWTIMSSNSWLDHNDNYWLHPDPDPVLADFTAWRLTHH